MILVDTSVWIEHFRRGNTPLEALLNAGMVLAHPFVIGELALGNLQPREATLRALRRLPQAGVATHHEFMQLIEQRRLFRFGIGYVDAHILAAVWLTGGSVLWTYDKRLHVAAENLGVAHDPAE